MIVRFLADGAYEGVKAAAHAVAGLLLLAFALYSGAAWWQRCTIARRAGVQDASVTHLAVGLVSYLVLALAELVIAVRHLESR